MESVNFNSCIRIKNKIWFLSVGGYLMNYDCDTYEAEVIAPSNLEELRFESVIDDMAAVQDKLYFVEQRGNWLYEYDMAQNYCNCYAVPETEFIEWGCFAGVYLYQQNIYFFAKTQKTVFRFNTIYKTFEHILAENMGFMRNSFRVGDKVYLYGDKVACYDMVANSLTQEYCPEEGGILYMAKWGDVFYCLTKKRILMWDSDGWHAAIIYEKKDDAQSFARFFLTENKIFILPSLSNDILILDRHSGAISCDIPPDDMEYAEKGWGKYYGYAEDDRYAWWANRVSNYVLCIDKEKEKTKWIKLKLPGWRKELPYLELKMERSDREIWLESDMPLEQFFLSAKKRQCSNFESAYGKKIWEMTGK